MDSLNEIFGIIRQLLSEPPSWEHWNQLILYLDSWPEDSPLLSRNDLQQYIEVHLQAEWGEQWLLGNEAWPEDSLGWKLCRGRKKEIRGLSDGYEIWCPPGQWSRFGTDDPSVQDFELDYGFWMQDAPFTTEDILSLHERTGTYTLRHSLLFTGTYDFRFEMRETLPDFDWLDAIRTCNLLSEQAGLEPAYELEYVGDQWMEPMLNNRRSMSGEDDWESRLYYREMDNILDGSAVFAWAVHWKGLKAEGYRLPTVAEWEVAILATSEIYTWNAFEVAQKETNAWGLRGFHNQHREWCWDQWDSWDENECKLNPCFLPEPSIRSLRCTLSPEKTESALLYEMNSNNVPQSLQYPYGGALRVCRTDLNS
jgi:hypothetical protein